MNATRALEISIEAKRTAVAERERTRADLLVRLRTMPEYLEARNADMSTALAGIGKAAAAGLTACSYSARREARPPNNAAAASALGEATGVVIALELLGYNTKLGVPYCTHDDDGPNGVNVVVHITWSAND